MTVLPDLSTAHQFVRVQQNRFPESNKLSPESISNQSRSQVRRLDGVAPTPTPLRSRVRPHRELPCRQGITGKFSRFSALYLAKSIACEHICAYQQGSSIPCRALGRELAGKRRIRTTASTARRVSDMFSCGFRTPSVQLFNLSRQAVSSAREDRSGRPCR